jgi:Uma2 family endonuclease
MARLQGDVVRVYRGVSWAQLQRFLADKGESSVPRPKYLDGVLEVVTPSVSHEKHSAWIGALLAAYSVARGIEMSSFRSWTLKDRHQRAWLEPDDCYVFGRLRRMPRRPHLAIEIQWSRSAVDKLEIYRRLRVREVWL